MTRLITRRSFALLSLGATTVLVERCLAMSGKRRPEKRSGSAWQLAGSNALRATDFGARGDGLSDDTAAIMAADAAASTARRPLFFPAGVYLIDPIKATTSWIGEGSDRCVLRYRGNASYFVNLVTASGVDGIRFVNLAFDGNVSTDPVSWSVTNHTRFKGAAGLSVESCENALVLRCRASNTHAHGFRFLKVRGGKFEDCTTDRSRGIYGDGILLLSSTDIVVSNCMPRDYTRIGIAADRTDISEPLCQRITIRNCNPEGGHNASAQFGGTEFNAGVWIENCVTATVEGVRTRDNLHRGISVCSGKKTSDFTGERAAIVVRNCETQGGAFGICIYSLVDLPIVAEITGCTALHASIAFQGAANTGNDSITWTDCHADYDASAGNGRGFATEVTSRVQGRPTFTIGKGCTISRWAEDLRKLEDPGTKAATADIGGYYHPAGPMRLNVEGVREVRSKPIYIRWYNDHAHDIHISDVDAYISRPERAGTTISARNANVRPRPSGKVF